MRLYIYIYLTSCGAVELCINEFDADIILYTHKCTYIKDIT
jgi:hypothetical protein